MIEMIADEMAAQPVAPDQALYVRMIESADIFRGQTEVLIRHHDVIYRMKITRQGKLILNK